MKTSLLLGVAALLGSAAPVLAAQADQHEVAYDQIAAGEAQQAIARLEAARERMPDDPALLINLGAAYAATGNFEKAGECYRAAIASDDRYELELANGEWMDPRSAARLALRELERDMVAMR
ncbi:tetratricopeptide repeat protein [Aurantiacibacter spongiae]|uniref:Tetratricopeptide repeat protein n=1 Tax=Aurantiacibacter spongiae TaxID=2488860 RepID=A0A3N5DJX9_9SPHN|nr:tetratricopeptide repeat protein [Aurantiacibacter spongiae]RPF71045.1 tetratricopeptide repeat protein [Aurantiacibacter spongiae]